MGIKVNTVLINNGILGYQKHAEHVKFGEHTSAVNFSGVDHAAIARACGIHGVRVESADAIAPALRAAMAAEEATLIEVMCTEDAFPHHLLHAGEPLMSAPENFPSARPW
jgi:acetolactate synthase-1/2/3 large subunit